MLLLFCFLVECSLFQIHFADCLISIQNSNSAWFVYVIPLIKVSSIGMYYHPSEWRKCNCMGSCTMDVGFVAESHKTLTSSSYSLFSLKLSQNYSV